MFWSFSGNLVTGFHVTSTKVHVTYIQCLRKVFRPICLPCHKGLIGGVLQRWLSLWKVFTSSQKNSGVTIRFLVTSLTKAFLPSVWPDSHGGWLVVPNFFHLRMMEATAFLGTFNTAEILWYPSPDLCLDTILSQSSWTIPSTSWLGFCIDMHCQLWDLI